MSTYKVLQDIESEDKLVGPLSLRQFIYAGIAAVCGYLIFLSFSKGVPFLAIVFIPPMLFTAFFAIPWGGDQSTEIWALAKLGFLLKPRRRIWDQSGTKELVTITVPKKIERQLTNGLDQYEVNSRLKALADTIDSRGWAVKNVNVNMYGQMNTVSEESDRLVTATSFPQEVATVDVRASDDILDEQANPIAQHFDDMIAASATAHRQEIMNELQAPVAPPSAPSQATAQNDYWFMHQPATASIPSGQAMFGSTPVVTPGSDDDNIPSVPHAATPTASEEALVEKFKAENNSLSLITQGHMKVIKTPEQLAEEQAARAKVEAALAASQQNTKPPVTPAEQAVIMNLSRRDDLNVATLARQAQQPAQASSGSDSNEVVISLH